MLTKEDAIALLTEDRNVEEKLAYDVDTYILGSLDEIKDINPEEKSLIYDTLTVISRDSIRHSAIFTDLLQKVFQRGKELY